MEVDKNKIIKKAVAFKSIDINVVYKILNLTIDGLLIPERDLIMLGGMNVVYLNHVKNMFIEDTLTYEEVRNIANLIVHNYAYPHTNQHNVYDLLDTEHEYLENLFEKIKSNLENFK